MHSTRNDVIRIDDPLPRQKVSPLIVPVQPPRQKPSVADITAPRTLNPWALSTAALALVCLTLAWQWQNAETHSAVRQTNLHLAWTANAELVDKHNLLLADADRMDSDHKNLITLLRVAQDTSKALRDSVQKWQAQHANLDAESRAQLQEWTAYGNTLRTNLVQSHQQLQNTQVAVQVQNETLSKERQAADQIIRQREAEKRDIEREANAFSNKAKHLESLSNDLDRQLSCAQSSLSSAKSENSRLSSCISSLEFTNSSLRSEIGSLKSEVCSLRNELARAGQKR
jgi:chromosome segregation ATPase